MGDSAHALVKCVKASHMSLSLLGQRAPVGSGSRIPYIRNPGGAGSSVLAPSCRAGLRMVRRCQISARWRWSACMPCAAGELCAC